MICLILPILRLSTHASPRSINRFSARRTKPKHLGKRHRTPIGATWPRQPIAQGDCDARAFPINKGVGPKRIERGYLSTCVRVHSKRSKNKPYHNGESRSRSRLQHRVSEVGHDLLANRANYHLRRLHERTRPAVRVAFRKWGPQP